MAEIKWIKLNVDVFDNRKIKQIEALPNGESIVILWFKMLCLAGDSNADGALMFSENMSYTAEMLATQFNRPLSLVLTALKVFEQYGMIETIDETIYIRNWGKHQNVSGMERIREQTRTRVARHRAKKTSVTQSEETIQGNAPEDSDVTHGNDGDGEDCNVTCNVTCNGDVTQSNATEEDIRIRYKNKRKYIKENATVTQSGDSTKEQKDDDTSKKVSRFHPPSLEEVQAYCKERKNSIDARRWLDYYKSKGWLIGKSPMKDWKAAVRTWERNQETYGYPKSNTKPDLTAPYEEFEGW